MSNLTKEDYKKTIKKFWNWLWHSESILSYLVFLIIVFIIIKLLIMPFLVLVTGTSLPLAIVESCSMYHEDNFITDYNEWWDYYGDKYEDYEISKQDFANYKFQKGFNKGDILFMTKADPNTLKLGDIIIFASGSTPIIHRIITISEGPNGKIFSTIGDHNLGQLQIEKQIHESQLIGKAQVRAIPYIGWIKLIFFEPFQPENNKGLCEERY
jgi:hypothetical protein